MAITQSSAPVTPGSGETISTVNVANGAATDLRQVICLGGPNTTDGVIIAAIASALPASGALGLVVREVAQGQATMANSRPVVIASDQSAIPELSATTTATLTFSSGTALNTAITFTSTGYNSAQFSLVSGGGTLTAGQLLPEISVDAGTNWFSLPFLDISGNIQSTAISFVGGISNTYKVNIAGCTNFRIRLSTAITGTGSVTCAAVLSQGTNTQIVIPIGGATVGSAVPSTATAIGGSDGTNLRLLKVSTTGVVAVDGSAVTQPVSGTVTSNIGTTNGLALDATIANVQSGAGATSSPTKICIIGGKTNDVTPAYQPIPLTVSGAAVRVDGSAVTQPISGTVTANAGTGTFAISASALPLPTGASTAAKQPALGTAGTASADVITVQGIASMTALKVDGSAVTQPVKPGTPTTSGYTLAAITFAASGDNTIVAGVVSQTIRIFRIFFVNSDAATATNITVKDSTPTSLSGAFRLASGGSFAADGEGDPLFVSASGKGIILNSSGAVQISGTVWYTQS